MRVVLVDAVWREKIVRDHPEIDTHMSDVLQAVTRPDHVAVDPIFAARTRYYARGVGPSGWLLVVVSYEQVPARIVSAFANNDVLYLHVGEPQAGEGEETPEGHVLRYASGTSRIVGLTVLGARRVLERDGLVAVTVPGTVETSAEQLAPALAAV